MRRVIKVALPVLASGTLLVLTLRIVDLDELANALRGVRYPWLALAVLASLPQMLCVALRWHFTARRIGGSLTYGRALADYYLSTLLNQLLPGGIAGDVVRAVRHRGALREQDQRADSLGVAVRAVMLERLAGQLVLWMLVVCSLTAWSQQMSGDAAVIAAGVGALVLVVALALLHPRIRDSVFGRALLTFARDGRAALLERGAWAVQLATSLVALSGLVAMFYCCARALGVALELGALVRTAPLVLGVTTLPITYAGWGLREATTAALWRAEGFTASQGVAVSVLFGAVAVVSSMPGILTPGLATLWARVRPRSRDRSSDPGLSLSGDPSHHTEKADEVGEGGQ